MQEKKVYNIYLIANDKVYRSMMRLYLEEKSAQEPDYDYTLFSFEDADQFFYALSSHPGTGLYFHRYGLR